MTAKEYLSRLKNVDVTIKTKENQLTKLKVYLQKITSNTANESLSGVVSDEVNLTIEKIVKLENSIKSDIGRLVDLQKEIANAISKVDDDNLRNLLELRYINLNSWKQIADEKNYSKDHVKGNLHSKALKKFSKILEF